MDMEIKIGFNHEYYESEGIKEYVGVDFKRNPHL
jgi:hypothetical protein